MIRQITELLNELQTTLNKRVVEKKKKLEEIGTSEKELEIYLKQELMKDEARLYEVNFIADHVWRIIENK